jgi:integrase
MSVQFDASRNRWVVRWYEAGHQRSRRFREEPAARRFDSERVGASAATREAAAAAVAGELMLLRARVDAIERQLPDDARTTGVSPYATRDGVRWRVAVRREDGSTTTRRGYKTREAAWQARERLGPPTAPASDTSFAAFWRRWLADKRPDLTEGAIEDLEVHANKRLLPHLAHRPLADLREPVQRRRTAAHDYAEFDYLRLHEIDRYLGACTRHYRPLAELLIGTGARVSEVLALTWPDIDLQHGVIRIQRQRARHGNATTQTKGKRPRSVLIGPRLRAALRDHRSAPRPPHEPDWLFICPRPKRGRYARRPATKPPSRKTVHEWHERALANAGLRDMPLHALRHTAAATWLSTGHSLIFVARQLGHRSISTTEHHYGHLELNLFTVALEATDHAIDAAGHPPHDG